MGVKKLVSLLVKYPKKFENSLILKKMENQKKDGIFFKTRVMMMLWRPDDLRVKEL